MRGLAALVCAALVTLSACAPRRVVLPTGAGTPYPAAAAAYEAATQGCRTVQALEATLSLSGRAGSQTLRGSLDAGFEAPASMRLEMRGPIGRAVFVLAAGAGGAMLYLPRDDRVLRHAEAAEIVEALVGLPLDPAALRAMISGCGFGVSSPGEGRAYEGGWVAVETGAATTYLRQIDGQWRVVGARRAPLALQYTAFGGNGVPSSLSVQAAGAPRADVTVRIQDVLINSPLPPEAFVVNVPAAAEPLTLDELRRAGPLEGR